MCVCVYGGGLFTRLRAKVRAWVPPACECFPISTLGAGAKSHSLSGGAKLVCVTGESRKRRA